MKSILTITTNFHLHSFEFDNVEVACRVARDFALHGTQFNVINDPTLLRVAVADENGEVLKFYKNVDGGYTFYFFDTQEECDKFFEEHETASFPVFLPFTKQWFINVKR